jgi:hypothetical protein
MRHRRSVLVMLLVVAVARLSGPPVAAHAQPTADQVLTDMGLSASDKQRVLNGKPTYVLTHVMAAPDGAARAIARRQYYASTGYNGEQSVAGFLPVQGGTVVVYVSHAFTDQVAGFGGSMKRSLGSSVMASKMKEILEAGRKKVGQ